MRLTRKEISTMKRWTMALIGVLFCLAAPMAFVACGAADKLEMIQAERQRVANDQTQPIEVREKAAAEFKYTQEDIEAAEALAERRGAEAAQAALLIPGGASAAGIVALVVRTVVRERLFSRLVNGIEAVKQADPVLAGAWEKNEKDLRLAIGESASKAVKNVKKPKTKGA